MSSNTKRGAVAARARVICPECRKEYAGVIRDNRHVVRTHGACLGSMKPAELVTMGRR